MGDEATPVGTLSRRGVVAQGLAVISAVLLAACGSSSASSTTAPSAADPSEMLDDAEINLLLDPNLPTLVKGTVAGLRANAAGSLYGTVPGQPSSVKGTFGGLPLSALLSQHDQVPSGSGLVTTTKLVRPVGPAVTSLLGQFALNSGAIFQKGSIAGTTQGRRVSATASPNSTLGSIGSAADVSGDFGGVPFSLVANLSENGSPNEPGTVSGKVGQKHIKLEIRPTNMKGNFSILRLAGTYSGPTDLLAIIVGVVAYFAA